MPSSIFPAVSTADVDAIIAGLAANPLSSNVIQIDGNATNANTATLNLKQLNIVNSAGTALVAQSTGSNGNGISAFSHGSGQGLSAIGGTTGIGILAYGGSASGHGAIFRAQAGIGDGIHSEALGSDGDGLNVTAASGAGVYAQGGGTTGPGIAAISVATSAPGIYALGNDNHGIGAFGQGTGAGILGFGGATGNGIAGFGGATSGDGITGQAAGSNSSGLSLLGHNGGDGLYAAGGATGNGGRFLGGSGGNTYGLAGTGNANGSGLFGQGGVTGHGVEGEGGATSGSGGYFEANAAGAEGLVGYAAGANAPGFAAYSTSGGVEAALGNIDGTLRQTWSKSDIVTNTTTTIKSGAGFIHAININKGAATSTITVYDNTAGSGTKIGGVIVDTLAGGTSVILDSAFATGLTVVTAGGAAADITVTYK